MYQIVDFEDLECSNLNLDTPIRNLARGLDLRQCSWDSVQH